MYLGIRTKLSLLTFTLVTVVIIASSAIVMGIMDTFLLRELVKRGMSLSRGVANAAGYSLLIRDRLSLDNLVSKIKERQVDIMHVAVIDHLGTVEAHNELLKVGSHFQPETGIMINKDSDGSMVQRVTRNGLVSYEFSTPIVFAGKEVGQFHLGIDAAALAAAQLEARRKVEVMAVIILLLSLCATSCIARIFTLPIKQLNEGVSLLKSGINLQSIAVSQQDELGELTKNFNEMASVIVNQQDKLAEYARGLEESYFSTVKILAISIDARDDYTMQHSTRVAALSLMVAEEMGLSNEEQRELEVAALVHDLGKIRIPDHILNKNGPLDFDEYQRVKRHPHDGADILRCSQSLHRFIPGVLYHHEWYNGQGYPEGLGGESIPLFAAIISIADSYDAMTSSRPYRAGLTTEVAIGEIIRCRGTQFNPRLSDYFVAALQVRNSNPMALTFLEMPVLNALSSGVT